jgi:cytochrome c oxidase cbb3-type subunit III
MKRFVNVIEVLALVAALGFAVALFRGSTSASSTTGGSAPAGQAIYTANCASCHGADGGGGIGPQLSGGAVVDRFPDADDQVDFVTHGRGSMPAFGGRLSAAEIRAVVEYTRTGLG